MNPNELLIAAARRLHYCRQFGPAHEINWALNMIDVAVCGMGYAEDRRKDLPKIPSGLIPGETPAEYAAVMWPSVAKPPTAAMEPWTVKQDAEGAWLIFDPEGEQVGRYLNAQALATHLAMVFCVHKNLRDQLTAKDADTARLQDDYDRRCHDMKILRQAMGCDGSDLDQLLAAWDALKGVVAKLPVKKILAACQIIDTAERRAMATDGLVPPTEEYLTKKDRSKCLKALWACREAAQAAAEVTS